MSVKEALSAAVSDRLFLSYSDRSRASLERICEILPKFENDEFAVLVSEFTDKHFQILKKVCTTAERCSGLKAFSREKLWREFHRVSMSTLSDLWKAFLIEIGSELPAIVQQFVNEKILKSLLQSMSEESDHVRSSARRKKILSSEEENIIRYVAGFVFFSMLKRYERQKTSQLSSAAVDFLNEMSVTGKESSLLEYTSAWIEAVNRGGLFQIRDECYLLFRSLEIVTRDCLPNLLKMGCSDIDQKEKLISVVATDKEIRGHWDELTCDLTFELREKLLVEVVQKMDHH